jgi:hypothetical protein
MMAQAFERMQKKSTPWFFGGSVGLQPHEKSAT